MVEDIVTTGLSSRECLTAIRAHPGELLGAACIIDRSNGRADVGAPLVPLLKMDVPAYPADALPPALAATTEDRRVGKECVRSCICWGTQYPSKNHTSKPN